MFDEISKTSPVLALAGGVGGAKLSQGMADILVQQELIVVVNTGDDEVFHGLHVSPDLDTVMYSLAGLANPKTDWGVADDTFNVLTMLGRYGASTWFNLGDRDLATHIERTMLLRQGWSLSEVTTHLSKLLGIKATMAPMSDHIVRTIVETQNGNLPFQEYFVKLECKPQITAVHFEGVQEASMSPGFRGALERAQAIIFCPSNPIVSIGPILSLPNAYEKLKDFRGPRIAVSPLVGEQAFRGPAANMLRQLGEEPSCVGVARRLAGICDVMIIDTQDAHRCDDIRATGLDPVVMDTIMDSNEGKKRVASGVLQIINARLGQ